MKLHGQGVSAGVAVGPVVVWQTALTAVPHRSVSVGEIEAELERLDEALARTRADLASLTESLRRDVSAEVAAIFEAHAEMLDDPELLGEVSDQIRSLEINAERALADVVGRYSSALRDLEDEYMRQRATDLEDVARRVLRHLEGRDTTLKLEQPSIIVAEDLTPSDTAQFPSGAVLGFATAGGGATSHTAILARALGIPAIVGIGEGVWHAVTGGIATLDGAAGELDLAPDARSIARFEQLHADQLQQQALARQQAQAAALTADGVHLEVLANIAMPSAAEDALQWGAEGVGLFRTEFLFLDRTQPPTEDEQYAAYRQVIAAMAGRRCLIRTADIGGDKSVPYLSVEAEANPFLGWRGARLLWGMESLLRTQLRAILRASTAGPVGIMFPMIAGLADLRAMRRLLDSVRAELTAAGTAFGDVAFGLMVEVPSAAVCADQLARECDFFSIGTNDLTQYTLACDRTNARIAHLLDPLHPAVLQLIKRTIDAGIAGGVDVGMCGELAADPLAVPLLVGLGLREFSVSPTAIPEVKQLMARLTLDQAQQIAASALEQLTVDDVRAVLGAALAGLAADAVEVLGGAR